MDKLVIRKVKTEFKEGYQQLITPETHISDKLSFGLLSIKKEQFFSWLSEDKETVLILLKGSISVTFEEQSFKLGPRKSIFTDRAYALWLPPGKKVTISSTDESNIAICQAPMKRDKNLEIHIVQPTDQTVNTRGDKNWTRKVIPIIGDQIPSQSLVIGETINLAGNWSSYPPHKHDQDNYPEESKQEEIYFYLFNPINGFGFQRLYTDDKTLDETFLIENGDLILIDQGYHPVVSAPGYELYYLWMLAGESRKLAPKDDSEHNWIDDT